MYIQRNIIYINIKQDVFNVGYKFKNIKQTSTIEVNKFI